MHLLLEQMFPAHVKCYVNLKFSVTFYYTAMRRFLAQQQLLLPKLWFLSSEPRLRIFLHNPRCWLLKQRPLLHKPGFLIYPNPKAEASFAQPEILFCPT